MLPFFYRCLQILLEQGAAVNTATQSGDTPLHLAVDGGHLVCCQLLLHHGADIILPGAVSQLQLMRDGRSGSLVMLTLEAIQWQILLFRMFLMLLSQFHPFLTFSAQIFDWTPENKLHPTDTPEFLNFLFHIVIPADKKRQFYPNYVVTFHMISTPFCWKENRFFPSSLCLCLCSQALSRHYLPKVPNALASEPFQPFCSQHSCPMHVCYLHQSLHPRQNQDKATLPTQPSPASQGTDIGVTPWRQRISALFIFKSYSRSTMGQLLCHQWGAALIHHILTVRKFWGWT